MVLTPHIRHVWFLLLLVTGVATADLDVQGVDGDLKRNIELFVALAAEPCDAEPWLIQRRFRNLRREALRALQPLGYYDAEIEASLDLGGDCWQSTVIVTPGTPVRLRDVTLEISGEGQADAAFKELLSLAQLNRGDILRHKRYTDLKQNLQTLSADRGYVEARFTENRLDIWPEEHAADISLQLDSGPRYALGDIDLSQDFLAPDIVDAYLDLEPGVPYNSQDLARAYRDLSDSAYFGRIDVVPDFDAAENRRIPVRVLLEPGDRTEYTVGAGISTDTGPRLRAGFRNNRVNYKGHRLLADLSLADALSGLSTEYRIPLTDPRREWFSITGNLSDETTDSFDSEIQGVGVRWSKAMSDSWLRTVAIDFSNESYDLGTRVATTRSVIPSLVFDHKRADRDIFPRRGRRLVVEFRGTDKMLGSTFDFLQTVIATRYIRSFNEDSRLIGRLNIGYTETSDFSRLPPTSRFFAGGDESVRGFEFDSIGPKDADGNVLGGARLLVGSIEYEHHLWKNFHGAVFVDAGNAFNGSTLDAEVGAGLGIKWRSPLGPLRFYVGFPVSDSELSPRVHLRLGADL